MPLQKIYFIRLLQKEVGNTPLQYINQEKIEKAQLILITEDIPVKNIAYLLAYEDLFLFQPLYYKKNHRRYSSDNIENYIKSNRLIIFTQRFTYFFSTSSTTYLKVIPLFLIPGNKSKNK